MAAKPWIIPSKSPFKIKQEAKRRNYEIRKTGCQYSFQTPKWYRRPLQQEARLKSTRNKFTNNENTIRKQGATKIKIRYRLNYQEMLQSVQNFHSIQIFKQKH